VSGRVTALTIALAGMLTSACVVGPDYAKPTLPRRFNAELSLAQARQAELSAFVEVYRSLGGGWQQEGRPTN
jgi:hypothetical protein